MVKKILFVCKFNRFRSQIAAGFFDKLKLNNNYIVSSAGLIQGQPIGKEVKGVASTYKIRLSKPKGLVREILNKQDIIVIVANDVPPSIFKNLKKSGTIIKVWKIPDAKETNKVKLASIVKQIRTHVEKLTRELS